jgi:RecA/RadA recombinase
MSKISQYGDTLDKSTISDIDEYIPSGNYMLNACLTGSLFRGYPNNRSVCIAGPSGTGKNYLILNYIREAQKKGYYIIFYDSENAVDKSLVEKFGIDPKKMRYEPCNTVQEFRSSVTALTDTLIEQKKKGIAIPKVMIILDSAGNLATQKEVEDAKSGSDKADMTRAKLLKSTFRILMTKMGICKIPFIFSNHTYMTQDLFAKQVGGGGTGPEYAASVIMFLGKAKLTEGSEHTGIVVTVKPNKNRFAKPIPVKIHISFNKGMNPYVGLEEFINWDTCGIQRGNILTDKQYEKLSESEKKDCRPMCDKDGVLTGYFAPKDSARKLVVRHLNDSVELNRLFTSEIITKEVLDELDENVIMPMFTYHTEDADEFYLEEDSEEQDV